MNFLIKKSFLKNTIKLFIFALIMFFSVMHRRISPAPGFILWAPYFVIFIISIIGVFTGVFIWEMRYLSIRKYSIALIIINIMAGLIFAILYYLYYRSYVS